jgi:penicillin-binding protein 2
MTRRHAVVGALALIAVTAIVAAVLVTRSAGTDPAADGRTEVVPIEAPRGRILDRSGKVLVEDGTLLEVRVDVDAITDDERRSALSALAALLETDRTSVPASAGVATGAPVTADDLGARAAEGGVVATGVGEEVRAAVEADPDRYPGVTVGPAGGRTYRYGALAAHVLGYVGRSAEGEPITGRAGAELAFDEDLTGTPGEIVYQLDASGQRVRELVDRRVEPEPGRDVYLTIDINLQYLVEKGLAAEVERRRGVQDNGCFMPGGCDPRGASAVAVDPRDGAVLALASYPTYDPMLFAGGISEADVASMSAEATGDQHDFPLLDRALLSQVPPASTFKPFVAHAAMAAELLTPEYVYDDTGVYRYSADCDTSVENNCSATNAGQVAHGAVDVSAALTRSSDTFFYKLGDDAWRARDRIGEEALQEGIVEWGFGEPTGIDLANEAGGRVPTPEWLMAFSLELNGDTEMGRQAGTWTAGVSGNMAVGQGDVLATPLQIATAYAALANGGTRWRPQLLLQSTDHATAADSRVMEPEAVGEVDLPAAWRDPLIAGLDDVTKAAGGTATTAFAGFDQSACPVMGKTGTAQVTGKNDSSLFAAVAPTPAEGRAATISIAAVFEEAGFGAAAAVPLVRRVLEPFASVGCDMATFGAPDSPFEAPLGGYFDVTAAQAEYVPAGTDSAL